MKTVENDLKHDNKGQIIDSLIEYTPSLQWEDKDVTKSVHYDDVERTSYYLPLSNLIMLTASSSTPV